jgi:hypothetical protein
MVRYKIPAMPFYLASLIIARELLTEKKKETTGEEESNVEHLSGAPA